jgi:hypothetical protein
MRWLGVLTLLGACGGETPPPDPGYVSLNLKLTDGVLKPDGFTSVEVIVHGPGPDQDIRRSMDIDKNKAANFEGIDLPPGTRVSVEATLRNDSGTAMGYGRTAANVPFTADAAIVVEVRRPIAYIAGAVSRPQRPPLHWTEVPATFSDLSVSTNLDGKTQVGGPAILAIAAGPNLFMITQATSDPDGTLVGAAKIVPIRTADHEVAGEAVPGPTSGAVLDGAGADDGRTLLIGTTAQLVTLDIPPAAPGAPMPVLRLLADGSFARVALLTTDTGEIDAIAIKNRGSTTATCSTSAELWWARLSGPSAAAAQMVATGGFSDIATDRGRAFYVDACKGELGELTIPLAPSTQLPEPMVRRTLAGIGTGRPTVLAVSNGQAYIGIETAPATVSLLVISTGTQSAAATDASRFLWNEAAQQVVRASDFRGVLRQLDATSAVFDHLEIGAGGDYVALTTSAHFHGDPVMAAHFPEITIDTEELRVFDASTGSVIQRYRSWCSGVLRPAAGDIDNWACASTAGQTAAASMFDHHIGSMTFLFGKK